MAVTRVLELVQLGLRERGWAYVPGFHVQQGGIARLLALARLLGEPLVADGMSAEQPVVHARADTNADNWEPFAQLGPIGWHNDFSTWARRPAFSLAWLCELPDKDSPQGAWRVVSCARVVEELERSDVGRCALDLLQYRPLPFQFAEGEPVVHFHIVGSRHPARVRFYGRALRAGLGAEPVPGALDAVAEWERAADRVGTCLLARPGDLLVCDNERAMHDRLEQGLGRWSVLCFAYAAER